MLDIHFKQHALEILRDCDAGRQRCGECPFLECSDNTTILSNELRRAGIDARECLKRDRQLTARQLRRGTCGD